MNTSLMVTRRTYISPKSKFDPDEDNRLLSVVRALGTSDWSQVAAALPGRNARQCRERWRNYVDPTLVTGNWTPAEDELLLSKFRDLGSKWDAISAFFQGRARNSIRNRFVFLQNESHKKETERSVARFSQPMVGFIMEPNIGPVIQPDREEIPPKIDFSLPDDIQEKQWLSCPREYDPDNLFEFILSIPIK
jgi:hypothetical protein